MAEFSLQNTCVVDVDKDNATPAQDPSRVVLVRSSTDSIILRLNSASGSLFMAN